MHPIAAVQFEYSLRRRETEAKLLPTLIALWISLVARFPLGSGFLAGTVDWLGEVTSAGTIRASRVTGGSIVWRDRIQPKA